MYLQVMGNPDPQQWILIKYVVVFKIQLWLNMKSFDF